MKKRETAIISLILILIMFSGCTFIDDTINNLIPDDLTEPVGPSRMVQQINVALHPRDPEYDRHYHSQENLNALLNLLREMSKGDIPEAEPELAGGQSYYSITATFANGESQNYYLLGHRYLRLGDDPWRAVTPEQTQVFIQYLMDHPSDTDDHAGDLATPETMPPETTLTGTGTVSETTVPVETGAA